MYYKNCHLKTLVKIVKFKTLNFYNCKQTKQNFIKKKL